VKITQTNPQISFKAGLTPSVVSNAAKYSAKNIENSFSAIGVQADFKNNRAIAFCCGIVSDIFDVLTTKFKLPFGAKPPSITVYSDTELLNCLNKGALGFCLPDSTKIITGKGVYETRSIFYNNDMLQSLTNMDKVAEYNHNTGFNSTNHFLHTIIHEWVHNIHDDLLYKAFGYDGTCPRTLQRYNNWYGLNYDPNPYVSGIQHARWMQSLRYTPEQREIIKKQISEYAAGRRNFSGTIQGGNPFELVAETVTKEVVNSLDSKTLMPQKNPFCANGQNDARFVELFKDAWYKILGG